MSRLISRMERSAMLSSSDIGYMTFKFYASDLHMAHRFTDRVVAGLNECGKETFTILATFSIIASQDSEQSSTEIH